MKAGLVSDENYRRKPDSNLGIYLIAAKVAQYILVNENRRENEEAKKKIEKKTSTQNLHLQQKRSEDFQKFKEYMNSLSSYLTKEFMFINIINLYSNTKKDTF